MWLCYCGCVVVARCCVNDIKGRTQLRFAAILIAHGSTIRHHVPCYGDDAVMLLMILMLMVLMIMMVLVCVDGSTIRHHVPCYGDDDVDAVDDLDVDGVDDYDGVDAC